MKRIIALMILANLAQPIFAGESVGLIVNFEESIEPISLNKGITKVTRDTVSRSLQNMKTYIEFSDPKLLQKFLPISKAADVLCNTAQLIFNGYVASFKNKTKEDAGFSVAALEGIDLNSVQNMEKIIKPLEAELKKVKGSFFSNISLGRKSEAQKLVEGAKDVLIQKMQEILNEFKNIKETRQIKGA